MFSISEIDNLPSIEALIPEWLDLLRRCPNHTIFQRPEWNIPWIECFINDKQLLFIVVREDGRLVGLAPLTIRKRKILRKFNVIEFVGSSNYASDYADFIIENNRSDIRNFLIDAIKERKDWDAIKLNNIPSVSETIQVLEEKLPHEIKSSIDTPAFIINNEADKKKLLTHKSLKRHFNGFNREGTLKIQHLTKAEEIEPYLENFFNQHIERWEDTHPSLFHYQEQKDFYRLLVKELTKNQNLIFTVLKNNDDVIAFHFGFNYLDKFYWYKPSFDIKLKQRSPGEALLQSLFQYTIDNNLHIFDFTVGDEAFKYRFSNTITSNNKLFFCRSSLIFSVFQTRAILGKIKRFIFSKIKSNR